MTVTNEMNLKIVSPKISDTTQCKTVNIKSFKINVYIDTNSFIIYEYGSVTR